MYDNDIFAQSICRRTFLKQSAYGLGGLALGLLMGDAAHADPSPVPLAKESGTGGDVRRGGVIRSPHYPIKAKRIIHLCMAGGASHLETFDNKPILRKLHGQPFPESLTKGQQLAQLQNMQLKALGCAAEFKKWGKSGQEITTNFPHIAGIADDICIIRS